MQWDVGVPPNDIPGLIATKNPDFQLVTEGATNPYIVFNTVSPNNNGALGKRAGPPGHLLCHRPDRAGPERRRSRRCAPPLTHLIAPGTDGSSPNFDDYPYNPAKAKQMLASRPAIPT